MKHTIVIAQAGWCLVGIMKEDGKNVTLTDASTIRVWGTSKGIGEIALCGAQKATVLDPCGEVSIPVGSVVFKLKCSW